MALYEVYIESTDTEVEYVSADSIEQACSIAATYYPGPTRGLMFSASKCDNPDDYIDDDADVLTAKGGEELTKMRAHNQNIISIYIPVEYRNAPRK